jgi:hypothetical protein
VHRRKKRQYENNKVQEIEHLKNQNRTRKFCKEVRIRKDFKRHLTLCKGEDGQIINEKEEILGRLQEGFQTLLKTPESELSADNTMQVCDYGEETIEPPPIMGEVENTIEKLKINISSGRTIKIW